LASYSDQKRSNNRYDEQDAKSVVDVLYGSISTRFVFFAEHAHQKNVCLAKKPKRHKQCEDTY
tara:strand:+ start:1099 stop:1287 length:189 start_codon:yes stop_codon:yes gene_type:complete